MQVWDFDKIDRWLAIHQPALNSMDVDGNVVIDGTYELCDHTGLTGPQVFDTFQIKLVIPYDFPDSLPRVFETAGRIPRRSNNHINDDGSICFGIPSIICVKQPNLTIDSFFENILRDYFLGYLHYLAYKVWPFGEISHGYIGVVEELAEILDCKPYIRIVRAMITLLSKKHRRDRWPCPCGSLNKLGNCCRPILNKASTNMSRSEAKKLIILADRLEQRAEYVKFLNKVAKHEKQMAKIALEQNIKDGPNSSRNAVKKKFGAHTVSPLAISTRGFIANASFTMDNHSAMQM